MFKYDFRIILSCTAANPGFPQAGGSSQGSRAGAHQPGAIPSFQPGAGRAGGQPMQHQPCASGTSLGTGTSQGQAVTPSQQDRVRLRISRNKARQRHDSSGQDWGPCLQCSSQAWEGGASPLLPRFFQIFLLSIFPNSLVKGADPCHIGAFWGAGGAARWRCWSELGPRARLLAIPPKTNSHFVDQKWPKTPLGLWFCDYVVH